MLTACIDSLLSQPLNGGAILRRAVKYLDAELIADLARRGKEDPKRGTHDFMVGTQLELPDPTSAHAHLMTIFNH